MLERTEVAARWERPGVLPEMTVGGLAGHLAHQIFSVDPALRQPESDRPPIALVDHFTRASWIDAPLDGEVNSGIRAKAEGIGAEGAAALSGRARAALAGQRAAFAGRSPDHVVFIPQTGWSLRLGDFLVTRMLELAVHRDDLAVSVGPATGRAGAPARRVRPGAGARAAGPARRPAARPGRPAARPDPGGAGPGGRQRDLGPGRPTRPGTT